MQATRAYHLVRTIASLGLDHAEALYGRELCQIARFTLRSHIAQKQANRARYAGATLKHAARQCQLVRNYRLHDMLSRREYRKASRYDFTAKESALMAQAFGSPFLERFDGLSLALADRFAHMPSA